jgi:hypothetical protein
MLLELSLGIDQPSIRGYKLVTEVCLYLLLTIPGQIWNWWNPYSAIDWIQIRYNVPEMEVLQIVKKF